MSAQRFHNQVWPLRDRLYRVALRLVGESTEAEDVVQETMIKLWEDRGGLERITNLEGWCVRLVKNLGIDKIRSRKRKPVIDLEQAAEIVEKSPGVIRQLESQDTLRTIDRAMQQLPEQRRLVIQLREVEEMSYKEIAAALDISIDQVRTDIHRGRVQLRKVLSKCDCHV